MKINGYVLALLLVLVAVLVEILIRPLFEGRVPLTIFTFAVTLAASYGGVGPGILATAVTTIVVEMLFANSFVTLLPGQPNLWLFVAAGVGISIIVDFLRRRNLALADAKQQLEIANDELARRSEDLAQSNEELKRLAYALSHDLQNPLRIVSVFSERLAGKVGAKLDEDAATSLQFILNGVRQAQEMIRRLLEYSVSAHQDGIDAETDLNTVLAGALADLRVAVEESGARIVVKERLPVVQADGDRLRQVLLNLIGNAIKYRGQSPPEIHVEARNIGNQWIVSVRDNGIGIDMQYSDKIFGLFERLHSTDDYEGSGIGLAICRTIIQRHGGRIWVESELGKGSTFYFTLPRKKALVKQVSA